MSESKANAVTFESTTYVAARPQVLACLKNVETSSAWRGWHLTFRGTEAELIAAEVATTATFRGVGTQAKRHDEFANDITVYRRRGSWVLELRTDSEGNGALPNDERPGKCPWWIKWGGEAEAATAEILKRFAQPAVRS